MLLKKEGFPEEDEFVLCTTTSIFHHGVFVNLDEYGKGGMIHISEVSPGRIRNIRDFVREGKKIVCKVLRINEEKGHIDLSLRRVNERQKKEKINEIKQEQKAEKIIEFVARKLGTDVKKLYDEISPKIFKKYSLVHHCFEDVARENMSLEKFVQDEKTAALLTESIKERMKPVEVFIGGELKLHSYSENGVEIIKTALSKGLEKPDVTIMYEGAGRYKIRAKAGEYKDAEKILEKSTTAILKFLEKNGGEGQFIRSD
ncbi:translation initiation factor IF-2 subunit alpha [Candidatus Woesearchaeota archaeon]|nr:translation initiation factor IF-2 subunit alpha [Candidatus Woesearchaeota archaeon]